MNKLFLSLSHGSELSNRFHCISDVQSIFINILVH